MRQFVTSLQSRKLMLAVIALAVLAANKQWTELVAVVLAYIGVEGAADFRSRKAPTFEVVAADDSGGGGGNFGFVDNGEEEEEDEGDDEPYQFEVSRARLARVESRFGFRA